VIYIGSEHNSRWFIKYAKLVRNTTILFFVIEEAIPWCRVLDINFRFLQSDNSIRSPGSWHFKTK